MVSLLHIFHIWTGLLVYYPKYAFLMKLYHICKSGPPNLGLHSVQIELFSKNNNRLVWSLSIYLLFLSLDKPPIEELRYFLEFQLPRVWAPVRDEHPGYQRKEPVCPSVQFSLMGKKLYISQEQVLRYSGHVLISLESYQCIHSIRIGR